MIANQHVTHQLRALALDESASLQALRRLAVQTVDPIASVVLAIVASDTERDRASLQGLVAGAIDVLDSTGFRAGCERSLTEISELSRTATARALQLRDLASAERTRDDPPLATLLEAMAADNDNDARLLKELARYLGSLSRRNGRVAQPS